MNKTLLTIICLFFSTQLFSQCIILDLRTNDCVSCRNNLSILQEFANQLPVFVVFSENDKEELADLEYKFGLSDYSIKYIFNNAYYKKYHKKNQTSNWYLLNQNSDLVLEGDLKEINKTILAENIGNVLSHLPAINHCHYNFTKDKIAIFKYGLDKIQILSKHALKNVTNINPRNFEFKYLQANLKGKDSIAFAENENGVILNTKAKGFRSGFRWFDINSAGEYYIMFEYVRPYFLNEDTISYNLHTCVAKYDTSGKITTVYPVGLDSLDKYDNYCHRFTLKNDSSFIAISHPPLSWFKEQLKAEPQKKINYITEYSINAKEAIVTPKKYYPFDLPILHRRKYFENYLSAELCSYPYMTFRYSNELYNLNTSKSCLIIDSATYYSSVNFKEDADWGAEKYVVYALKSLIKSEQTIIAYKLGEELYLKSFKDLIPIKNVKVGNLLKDNNIENCFIDPYSEQVYFSFENETNNISLPLSLYGF